MKMSNVSGKVQNKVQRPSPFKKKILDGKVKNLVHWCLMRIQGREVVFIMKFIVCHKSSKGMG